jgi:archaemetzincin
MNTNVMVKILMFYILIGACNGNGLLENNVVNSVTNKQGRGIILQPYAGVDEKISEAMYQELRKVFKTVQKRTPISIPVNAFYKARNRYRADTIIKFQRSIVPNNFIMIGITHKNISTNKGPHKDYGIMGLAYQPGNSCIASYNKLPPKNKEASFFKIIIHELGHAEGLGHCENTICFMRDAEGKNRTALLTQFCSSCKSQLLRKGWRL